MFWYFWMIKYLPWIVIAVSTICSLGAVWLAFTEPTTENNFEKR